MKTTGVWRSVVKALSQLHTKELPPLSRGREEEAGALPTVVQYSKV